MGGEGEWGCGNRGLGGYFFSNMAPGENLPDLCAHFPCFSNNTVEGNAQKEKKCEDPPVTLTKHEQKHAAAHGTLPPTRRKCRISKGLYGLKSRHVSFAVTPKPQEQSRRKNVERGHQKNRGGDTPQTTFSGVKSCFGELFFSVNNGPHGGQ